MFRRKKERLEGDRIVDDIRITKGEEKRRGREEEEEEEKEGYLDLET